MTTTNEQPSITSSLRKGINYYFKDGDIEIQVFVSMLSGMERVLINGKEVSKKRSMTLKTLHKFTYHETCYEIEVEMTNMLLAKIDCTLIKNGTHVQTLKFHLLHNGWKTFYILLGFALGAGIAGYITGRSLALVGG